MWRKTSCSGNLSSATPHLFPSWVGFSRCNVSSVLLCIVTLVEITALIRKKNQFIKLYLNEWDNEFYPFLCCSIIQIYSMKGVDTNMLSQKYLSGQLKKVVLRRKLIRISQITTCLPITYWGQKVSIHFSVNIPTWLRQANDISKVNT